jgi:hypothetical protein
MPWWAWLLIALALAALLWLLFALFNNDADEAVDPALVPAVSPAAGAANASPVMSPSLAAGAADASPAASASPMSAGSPSPAATATAGSGATITDPAALILIPVAERPALVGRPVLIESVPVRSVPGDRTFLVGQDQDQPLLVVLDETQSAGPTEGQVNVNPGQTVSIVGQIQALPSMEEARQQWDLNDETLSQIKDDQLYVLAKQVKVADKAAGASPSSGNAAASPSPTVGAMNASPAASSSPTAGAASASPAASPSGAGMGEPITDLLLIVDASDQPALVGKQVQSEGVKVQSVVGDKTFWVGPSTDQQLFVVLEEDPSAGPTEGQLDINPGQTVTLTGEVRQLPPMDEARAQWSLSDANSAQLANQQVYLYAKRANIIGQ